MTRRTRVQVKQGLLGVMEPPVMLSVKANDTKGGGDEERVLAEAAQISNVRHLSWESSSVTNHENPVKGGAGGLSRTKSVFSISSSLESTSSASSVSHDASFDTAEEHQHHRGAFFGRDVREYTGAVAYTPAFDTGLRKVMEPHLRRARLLREQSRHRTPTFRVDASIAGSMGVPYTQLRRERPFLFDEYTYPLHQILAETLHVQDLSQVHQLSSPQQDVLLQPLLDREQRHAFHQTYDSFVTSFCIPLLHSLAMDKNVFHVSSSDRITYRYQAFPNVTIVRPGQVASEPTCATSKGHSIASLTFHIPLTPSLGTNALYTESHAGREDWHTLAAKSFGLGYLYDGARCLSFGLENTTDTTRVSLDFCVAMYSADDDVLCAPELLQDKFCRGGYYDEAVIDLRHSTTRLDGLVLKKNGRGVLLDPDYRVGPPFG